MAIFHLEGKIISRSQGRSSVAASAYRSAEKLLDERTGLTHDFTKKQDDIDHKEILLPEDAPEFMKNREQLWNYVEKRETRKDSQLCREFNISLPKELTAEQGRALAKEFVQEQFVNRGMVADLCIHKGNHQAKKYKSQDTENTKGKELKTSEPQPHMHVMLSMRELTQDGFGKKVRDWNDRALIQQWREAWANTCNRHLALNGHDIRIDHRTLEAQGIDLEPQTKIGPKASQDRMARYAEHQRIAFENGERILKDPSIALDAMTKQQSTFTHKDLARFINRHSETPEQFTKVYEVVKASPDLVKLGIDAKGQARYTTKEMLAMEKLMVARAITKTNQYGHSVNLLIETMAAKTKNLSEDQVASYKHILNSGDIACVVGFAGTGKSYMLGAAREAWETQGYQVHGMTLSGIAAETLESSSNIKSHTIANRLLNWENGRECLTGRDVVVIDEAGMVGSRQMATIMKEAERTRAKVVLVGDPEQLQAIAAGAAFRAIAERTGFSEMSDIRRQAEVWQQQATKNFAIGETAAGLQAYEARDHVHGYNTKTQAMDSMIEQWQETRSNTPEKSQIILAYTRADVRELNERARQARKNNGELETDYIVKTERGERNFATGDRIYFLRNEKSLGVKNGSLGTIEKIDSNSSRVNREINNNGKIITVKLDHEDPAKARNVRFHVSDYNDIDHGYAATVYKSQGVTVDRSHVLVGKYFDRHSTYVAMSRHREGAEVYWSRDQFYNFRSAANKLSRERVKDVTLDYSGDYAVTRGIETDYKEQEKQQAQQQQKDQERSARKGNEQTRTAQKRIEQACDISTNLITEERLEAAAKRLKERAWQNEFNRDKEALEKELGRKVGTEIKVGEQGVYRGAIELAGKRFGMLEQGKGENKETKVIPREQCRGLFMGEKVCIAKTRDLKGHEKIKAMSISKSKGLDRGMDIDF